MVLVRHPSRAFGGSAEVTALVTKSSGPGCERRHHRAFLLVARRRHSLREAETKGGKVTVPLRGRPRTRYGVVRAYSGSVEATPLEIIVGG